MNYDTRILASYRDSKYNVWINGKPYKCISEDSILRLWLTLVKMGIDPLWFDTMHNATMRVLDIKLKRNRVISCHLI